MRNEGSNLDRIDNGYYPVTSTDRSESWLVPSRYRSVPDFVDSAHEAAQTAAALSASQEKMFKRLTYTLILLPASYLYPDGTVFGM